MIRKTKEIDQLLIRAKQLEKRLSDNEKMEATRQQQQIEARQYKVDIPDGKSGDWKVDRFEVSEDSASLFNIVQIINSHNRQIISGQYTRLSCKEDVVMSDTPIEVFDHLEFIHQATGDVLINGLGLGMCVSACLAKQEVESVTVIENSPDVIALVAPHIANDRLTIIEADALEYKPVKGSRFGAVWHDIWPDISPDNLPQMHKLHRRYGQYADWQGSWGRRECERLGQWK